MALLFPASPAFSLRRAHVKQGSIAVIPSRLDCFVACTACRLLAKTGEVTRLYWPPDNAGAFAASPAFSLRRAHAEQRSIASIPTRLDCFLACTACQRLAKTGEVTRFSWPPDNAGAFAA